MTASRVLPAATAVLAHKRLNDIAETLGRKVGGGNYDFGFRAGTRQVRVRDTERRVLAMATETLAQLGSGERIDLPPTTALGPGPSRFVTLGTTAFDLPAYADLLGGNRAWVSQVLRTGNPDPHRSPVVAHTTRLALAFVGQATIAGADPAKSRPFAHGIIDAAATGIVVDPVLAGIHARRSTRDWQPLDPAIERVYAEARALTMIGPDGPKRWPGFWPTVGDVPDELLTAYLAALEEVHSFTAGRLHGLPSFEAGGLATTLPDIDQLRSAYGILRLDLSLSGWNAFQWWAFLLPLWVAPSIGLIIARELPAAQFFFHPGALTDASFTEAFSLATGIASLTPLVWSMILWSQVPDRTGVFVESLLLFLARVGLTTAFAATTSEGSDAGVRWGLALPLLGADIYALIRALIDLDGDRPFDAFVRMLQMIPSASGFLTALLAALAKLFGVSDDGGFWAYWAIVTVVMLLLGIPIAVSLTGSGLRNILLSGSRGAGLRAADAVRALSDPAVTDPSAPALVFDDSTLWADGGGDSATLIDLRYPSGHRDLIRIWWAGADPLTIAHDGHAITFHQGATDTPVVVPRSGRTTAALASAITDALPDLHAEVVDAAPDPDLPWPFALADPGDEFATRTEHDLHAADAKPVGATREKAYLLRQAPRVDLASVLGAGSATASGGDDIPLVPNRSLSDLEQTAIGAAADLAVLMHLGAAPWMATVVPPAAGALPPLPALGKSYEVFRHWNLDMRRVNEWRMIVQGGAESEKAGQPQTSDPGMLAGRPAANAVPAGSAVADAMGWLGLWRAWLRMASDLTADSAAAIAMPYTPTVRRSNGTFFQPTNADLSAGIRYLLDLP